MGTMNGVWLSFCFFVFLFFCLFSLETKRVYDHSIECIFEKELSQFNEKKEEKKKIHFNHKSQAWS